MNVVAYTALHYGKEYLGYAIRSVIDHVDAYYCLYTPIGSHGHRTDLPCPDTRDELCAIAQQAAGSKLVWHEGIYPQEGAHREMIHQLAPDADVVLVVDADEVWGDVDGISVAQHAIAVAIGLEARTFRVPFIHYWRSFYRQITQDPAYPIRVIVPKRPEREGYIPRLGATIRSSIHHFGYAQRPEIVRYKLETHGHKGEFRKDVNWFEDIFMANCQYDCHPIGSEFWFPDNIDPWQLLPDFMLEHPYANLQVIE